MHSTIAATFNRTAMTAGQAQNQYLHDVELQVTNKLKLAADFINRTQQHVFLTGKAGTGKTTFLRQLSASTHKRHVIVAPTGIAALNAGGMTIHSLFLLPPSTFIPDRNFKVPLSASTRLLTPDDLVKVHRINARRKKILRNIELMIIDEVSMLRADLLDAMDFRLRYVKRNYKEPFGGVQLLMIGDLYQLPPIVKEEEFSFLQPYYKHSFFFESQALRHSGFVTVELDTIFRQTDHRFVDLLNALRNNRLSVHDIELLNSHYRTEEEVEQMEEVITLTTHNYRAEDINEKALRELPGREERFHALIEGEFPESIHPIPDVLRLKQGAQVMFVRNDSSGQNRYYNGLLATVSSINSNEHGMPEITVEMVDDRREFTLVKETWLNVRYEHNPKTNENEEVEVGKFEHFPIKLAWAITVHKSQGLTFDRAIVDVGKAFAAGQVYVALSRLRSLDGLILRTRINPAVVATDPTVVGFTEQQPGDEVLGECFAKGQVDYLRHTLHASYDFSALVEELEQIERRYAGKLDFNDEAMDRALGELRARLNDEAKTTRAFRQQIDRILKEEDSVLLHERLEKARAYYDGRLRDWLKHVLVHIAMARRYSKVKQYVEDLEGFDLVLQNQRERIAKAAWLAESILTGKELPAAATAVSEVKKDRAVLLIMAEELVAARPLPVRKRSAVASKKTSKGETYRISQGLYLAGKSIAEIAMERKLAESTIEGHIVKGVLEGSIPRIKYIGDEAFEAIKAAMEPEELPPDVSRIVRALGEAYTYNQVRTVVKLLQPDDEADED